LSDAYNTEREDRGLEIKRKIVLHNQNQIFFFRVFFSEKEKNFFFYKSSSVVFSFLTIEVSDLKDKNKQTNEPNFGLTV